LVIETGDNPNGLCEIVKNYPDVLCYPAKKVGHINALYNTDEEEINI